MHVSDDRLGQVLTRGDHLRHLHQVNPIAHAVVEQMAAQSSPWDREVREAAWLLLDELAANEEGAPRLSLPTALAVLSAGCREEAADPEHELRQVASVDPLLRLSVDALTGYSTSARRRRSPRERGAVASALLALLKMLRAQEQAEELRAALGEGEA